MSIVKDIRPEVKIWFLKWGGKWLTRADLGLELKKKFKEELTRRLKSLQERIPHKEILKKFGQSWMDKISNILGYDFKHKELDGLGRLN